MNKLLKDVPSDVQYEITNLIYSGNKIGAIKRYRESANCDLMTAKDTVEAVTAQLKAANPLAFNERQPIDGGIYAAVIVFLIIGGVEIAKITDRQIYEWQEKFNALLQIATGVISDISTTVNQTPETAITAKAPEPIHNTHYRPVEQEPSQPIEQETPYQPIAPDNIETDLITLYRRKLTNSDYVAWANKPGIPHGYQDFIEEHHIKYVRSKIAKNLTLPASTKAMKIPVITDQTITIDGTIQVQEWQQAARIPLVPEETGTVLYLQADNDWLYLAADVPGDTTPNGFDQFRFYIHVDIDPAIRNERIHVDRSEFETVGGIRQTQVLWQGDPPNNDNERWKKYPISDWCIYRMAKGASTLQQHRQFEAKLNLKESGLTIGSPLPVFAEVETDPIYVDGKFKRRVYLGGLGSQDQPVWMVMKK
ncbi:hypothetical protein [Methylobacter sp.]|uniref:hypothetical protein n=1 Tax=Methylobacter sp. TaxID=2051955 RepID=UPI0011F46ACA|nr:hypothetical protein [Methylobacter sp.]TAK60315.1 MAG: hypothetical protein EPO18_17520 [Methylobacter sp.]